MPFDRRVLVRRFLLADVLDELHGCLKRWPIGDRVDHDERIARDAAFDLERAERVRRRCTPPPPPPPYEIDIDVDDMQTRFNAIEHNRNRIVRIIF